MAFAFQNINQAVTDTQATVYTTPTSKQTIAIGLRVANKGATSGSVTVIRYNASQDEEFYIAGLDTPIPVGGALNIADGNRLVFNVGDELRVIGSDNDLMDITFDYLELDA